MEVLMGKIIELNGGCPLPSGNSKFIPCPHPDSALHMSRQVGQKPTFSMFVQTLLEGCWRNPYVDSHDFGQQQQQQQQHQMIIIIIVIIIIIKTSSSS
jgi:hypothetical protein